MVSGGRVASSPTDLRSSPSGSAASASSTRRASTGSTSTSKISRRRRKPMANKLELIVGSGKPHFQFRRVFDAPRELVWEAMTKAEHVARWYGPRKMTAVVKEMDFRVGGKWR